MISTTVRLQGSLDRQTAGGLSWMAGVHIDDADSARLPFVKPVAWDFEETVVAIKDTDSLISLYIYINIRKDRFAHR